MRGSDCFFRSAITAGSSLKSLKHGGQKNDIAHMRGSPLYCHFLIETPSHKPQALLILLRDTMRLCGRPGVIFWSCFKRGTYMQLFPVFSRTFDRCTDESTSIPC